MSMLLHQESDRTWLTSNLLKSIPHGFSTRLGGVSPAPWDSLNLRPGMDDGEAALRENYRRFCACTGVEMSRLVLSKQVHETTVRACTGEDAGKGLDRPRDYSADALITNETNLPLVVFSADCGTVLLHDPEAGCIGAVHAGWRGCAGGIVEKTVRELVRLYGAEPGRITAALGPCIGACCFETDSDVPEAMLAALGGDALPYLERHGAKWHVDLAGLNRQWLLRAGLSEDHIDLCSLCTMCRPDLFWSHRRLGDARGVQCAVISL